MPDNNYLEILSKLAQDLEKALVVPSANAPEEEKKKYAQLKPFLEEKLGILRAKVIPVAKKSTLTEQDVIDGQLS